MYVSTWTLSDGMLWRSSPSWALASCMRESNSIEENPTLLPKC